MQTEDMGYTEEFLKRNAEEVQRAVMAAMETGNHSRARSLITELADIHLEAARSIRADVVKSYGVHL